jgi:folate/biopterin transporter
MFPLLIACAAALVREDPARDADEGTNENEPEGYVAPRRAARALELGTALWSVGKRRAIWAPALFVFLWQATPNPGTAMFYFQTNQLGFQPEFLGRVALARAVAALAGVFLYNAYLKKTPLKKMFFGSAVAGASLGLTQLILVTGLNREWGIDDRLFSLGDSVLLTVLGEVSFLPVLVLAARVCPAGVEATLFAALMSVFNAGGVVSGALGAALTSALGVTSENFDNLFWLVIVCNLSSLAPLAGLGWLDEAPEDDEPGGAPEAPRRA